MTKTLKSGAYRKQSLIIACWLLAVIFASQSLADRADVPPSSDSRADRADFTEQEVDLSSQLQISGAISSAQADGQIEIGMALLETLPRHSLHTSTVVTDGILKFEGVLMRDLLNHVGASGKTVTATARNGYQVDIPIRDFVDFDVVLAWAADGKRLQANDKGPFWIIYPRDQHAVLQDIRYDYRWVWQLNALRVN